MTFVLFLLCIAGGIVLSMPFLRLYRAVTDFQRNLMR